MTHSDFKGGKIKFDVFNHQILSEGGETAPSFIRFADGKKESPEMLLWHVTECKRGDALERCDKV